MCLRHLKFRHILSKKIIFKYVEKQNEILLMQTTSYRYFLTLLIKIIFNYIIYLNN